MRNKLLKKHFSAVYGILNDILYKHRGFWEAIEQIRALYASWDGYSKIYIQKNTLYRKARKTIFRVIIFRKIILIILAQENLTRKSGYTRILIVIQGEFIEVVDIKL